jgi:hypothetical protein
MDIEYPLMEYLSRCLEKYAEETEDASRFVISNFNFTMSQPDIEFGILRRPSILRQPEVAIDIELRQISNMRSLEREIRVENKKIKPPELKGLMEEMSVKNKTKKEIMNSLKGEKDG